MTLNMQYKIFQLSLNDLCRLLMQQRITQALGTEVQRRIKWQPHALLAHLNTVFGSAYLRAANRNDEDNNNKCQHLMFDDRFCPVAIFITVRPLSSPAREQSHYVSLMDTLSKKLIWF